MDIVVSGCSTLDIVVSGCSTQDIVESGCSTLDIVLLIALGQNTKLLYEALMLVCL